MGLLTRLLWLCQSRVLAQHKGGRERCCRVRGSPRLDLQESMAADMLEVGRMLSAVPAWRCMGAVLASCFWLQGGSASTHTSFKYPSDFHFESQTASFGKVLAKEGFSGLWFSTYLCTDLPLAARVLSLHSGCSSTQEISFHLCLVHMFVAFCSLCRTTGCEGPSC